MKSTTAVGDSVSLMDNIVTMYMAQTPRGYPPKPSEWIPVPGPGNGKDGTVIPMPPLPNTGYTYLPTNKDDIDTLLDAIFALQGGTAEIYKLKALAFTIKAGLNDKQGA